MPIILDLVGQTFNKLTVLEKTGERQGTSILWKCRCDCGKIVLVSSLGLRKGFTKSCGCLQIKDLVGKKFGRLTVLAMTDKRTNSGKIMWKCQCECGNIIDMRGNALISGNTKSCGCLYKEKFVKDLMNQKFGRLTVLEKTNQQIEDGIVIWKCQCDCKNIVFASTARLIGGNVQSCGCLRNERVHAAKFKDASNSIISEIQVKERTLKTNKNGSIFYFAICPICKREDWEVNIYSLRSGQSTKCRKCSMSQHISKSTTDLFNNLETYLNIKVEREYQIDRKFYDGYIPKLNLLIEVDGTYWHLYTKQSDLYKETLARENGFNFLRITCDSVKEIPIVLPKLIEDIDHLIFVAN